MPTNSLLIKFGGGWAERSGAATPERIEAMLAIGAITSVPEAYRIADSQIAIFADMREQTTVGLSPADDTVVPYENYTPGDTVTSPTFGGASTERIQAVTVVEDDATGEASFTVDIKDVVLDAQEAFDNALKKMAPGALAGKTTVPQPVIPSYSPTTIATSVSEAGPPT